jgi:hypothetical protein
MCPESLPTVLAVPLNLFVLSGFDLKPREYNDYLIREHLKRISVIMKNEACANQFGTSLGIIQVLLLFERKAA